MPRVKMLDQVWDFILSLPDAARRSALDRLLELSHTAIPDDAQPVVWDIHGTATEGYSVTFDEGRGFLPYLVTETPSGQVVTIIRPVWLEERDELT